MTRRILAITIAIVLAALGTAGGLFLVLSADPAPGPDQRPVTVAIAVKRIAVGTTGASVRADKMVRLEKMPKASVPSDALPRDRRRAGQAGGHLEHRARARCCWRRTSASRAR